MSVNEKMTAIADNIRERTGGTESLTLDDMASGVNDVYEAGKKSEYDEFWDSYQNPTTIANDGYSYAFMKRSWNDKNFKPKYNLKAKDFYMAFYNTGIKDIPACLERQGVVLDTSESNSLGSIFSLAKSEVLPSVDTRRYSAQINFYSSAWNCHTIGTLILKDNGTQVFSSNCFYDTPALKNITFEGRIGSSISFSYSPLTIASLKSIITHLKDYSTDTANHNTYTVTFKSTAFAELEAEGATAEYNGVACTWAELIDNLKWNLALA